MRSEIATRQARSELVYSGKQLGGWSSKNCCMRSGRSRTDHTSHSPRLATWLKHAVPAERAAASHVSAWKIMIVRIGIDGCTSACIERNLSTMSACGYDMWISGCMDSWVSAHDDTYCRRKIVYIKCSVHCCAHPSICKTNSQCQCTERAEQHSQRFCASLCSHGRPWQLLLVSTERLCMDKVVRKNTTGTADIRRGPTWRRCSPTRRCRCGSTPSSCLSPCMPPCLPSLTLCLPLCLSLPLCISASPPLSISASLPLWL